MGILPQGAIQNWGEVSGQSHINWREPPGAFCQGFVKGDETVGLAAIRQVQSVGEIEALRIPVEGQGDTQGIIDADGRKP